MNTEPDEILPVPVPKDHKLAIATGASFLTAVFVLMVLASTLTPRPPTTAGTNVLPPETDKEGTAVYLLSASQGFKAAGIDTDSTYWSVANTGYAFTTQDPSNGGYYIKPVRPDNGDNQNGSVDTSNWTNMLVHVNTDGSQSDVGTFGGSDYTAGNGAVAISADGTRIAYCLDERTIEISTVPKMEKTVYAAPHFCDIGNSGLRFSRDGSQLLTHRGYYENYRDCVKSAEECARLEQEEDLANGIGIYSLDVSTHQETYLGTDAWAGVPGPSGRMLHETPTGVQVRDASGVSVVLSQAQYESLPLIASTTLITKPHTYIWDTKLTLDGTGVWYAIYGTDSDPSLGYYDFSEKKNYFPLASTSYEFDILVQPLNKNTLYYVLRDGGQSDDAKLYQASLSGTPKLIRDLHHEGGGMGYLFVYGP